MEDQLASLEKLGIKAAKLNASSTKEEVNMVQTVCQNIAWQCYLIYIIIFSVLLIRP